jgi:hypothetical protein
MMTPERKPRCDSKLKNQSEDMQLQIAMWCETPKSKGCEGGHRYAWRMLKEKHGMEVGLTTVSTFYAWYITTAQFGEAQAFAKRQEELMLKFDPKDADRARAFGEFTFIQKALGVEDPTLFKLAAGVADDRRLRELKERIEPQKLALARRRLRLMERQYEQQQGSSESPALNLEDKVARMKEIFGVSY